MRSAVVAAATAIILLTGCGGFFKKGTGGGGGGGTTSTDLLYVSNSNPNLETIAGFSIASAKLAITTSSPYDVGLTPFAMALTPSNKFLYASGLGGIVVFTVNANGSLTQGNGGVAVGQAGALALQIDRTGKYLVAVDGTSTIYVYSINTDGTLTVVNQGTQLATTGNVSRILFTPNNLLVYVSMGTGGVNILTFDPNSGTLTLTNQILKPKGTGNSDAGLATDSLGRYLFVTETGVNGVRMLTIATSGALKEVTGSPYKTGLGPSAVMVDASNTYVYVTNRTDGTISGFTLTPSATLTAISTSPFAIKTGAGKANGAAAPVDLVEDNTKSYIAVACNGGSPDMAVFSFDTTTAGQLNQTFTATTGTSPTQASAIVAAH